MVSARFDFRAILRRAGVGGEDASPGDVRSLAPPGDVIVRRPRPRRTWSLQPALERARALARASVSPQVVAISVEGAHLRFLTYANRTVLGWATELLDVRSARGGQINDPVALGTVLDETFDRLQLPRKRVAWALPGFQAATCVLDVPRLQGDELRRAVEEEAEHALGASTSDCFLYWQRLEGRIRRRGVFVLAVPKAAVLGALEALDVANVRPWTMDLRPLALARAVGRPDAVVANLEEGSLDLVILQQTVPTLVRCLPVPTAAAGEREAAQERLVQEAERTLAYYDDLYPDQPLDPDTPLYLTGSLATGIGLAERLRAVTRHPIGRLAGLPPHPEDFPVAEYLVNLGLALKEE